MLNQENMRFLNFLNGALGDKKGMKWFFSYGTLLYFIRDFRLGKPFETDYDICLINADVQAVMYSMESVGFRLEKKIINDVTKEPLQLVYRHKTMPDKFADLFFMVETDNHLWHNVDVDMEMPKDGIPKKYVFKGVEKEAFSGEVLKYKWEENIAKVPFPAKYGTLLDLFYPGWFIPDKNFGQSKCQKTIELPHCVQLKERLYEAEDIEIKSSL